MNGNGEKTHLKTTSPSKTRRAKIVRPPTDHEFVGPGPSDYFPDIVLETEKEIMKRALSPIPTLRAKSPVQRALSPNKLELPVMLPYMVGYKALSKNGGISLGFKTQTDYRMRELIQHPSSHHYYVKSPSRLQKGQTMGVKAAYRGIVVRDDF